MSARRQLSKSLRNETLSFGLVPSHSQFRTRTEVIDNLGCQAMAVLFGGNGTDSLATMRYNIFSKKVVSASSFVSPERLPPTESATKLHFRSWSGQERGGYGSQELWVDPAGQSARPTYVKDECCSRHSVENHTLQLLDCLQNTALLL